MRDQFVFRNHLCILFDILGLDLYEVIKKQKFRGLAHIKYKSGNVCQYYAYQML